MKFHPIYIFIVDVPTYLSTYILSLFCLFLYSDGVDAGSSSKDLMTQGFYPSVAIRSGTFLDPSLYLLFNLQSKSSAFEFLESTLNDEDSRCLLDRIQLKLDQIEVYIGKRHGKFLIS